MRSNSFRLGNQKEALPPAAESEKVALPGGKGLSFVFPCRGKLLFQGIGVYREILSGYVRPGEAFSKLFYVLFTKGQNLPYAVGFPKTPEGLRQGFRVL